MLAGGIRELRRSNRKANQTLKMAQLKNDHKEDVVQEANQDQVSMLKSSLQEKSKMAQINHVQQETSENMKGEINPEVIESTTDKLKIIMIC